MRQPHLLAASTALLLGIALASSACSDSSHRETNQLTVVATTTVLADIAANIVGDDGDVSSLLPIDASPHDYQASAQQVANIQSADLVIANGLLLEEGLIDILDSAMADGANVVEIGPLVDPLPFQGTHHDEHDEHDASDDPHFWLDPERSALAANLIGAQLAEIDPSIDWASRAAAYADRLLTADLEIAALLESIPPEDRKLVTNHGSFGYFAARYDFEIIGIVIPGGSTLADPSSSELANLVESIEQEDVPAIFGETTESSAVAEAIAAEVGELVQVIELYTGSLGEPGSGAETLIDMLKTNAKRIANALG
ncbi:MAG: zinc ABC transporter substrate-binding protein [bacterium]|nr:zinc ABC transporter substrate-binding protein [bacterium]